MSSTIVTPSDQATQNEPRDTRMRFWDLRFRDSVLENDYRQSYFETDIKKTRIGLVCAALILLMFSVVGPYLLETPVLVNQVRVLFVMPIILLCIIATFSIREYLHWVIVCCTTLATLSQIAILPIVGESAVTNVSMAYLQYILFMTVLLFQPFRFLVVPVVALDILMILSLRSVGGEAAQIANYEMATHSVSFVSLFFAYVKEQSQRQLHATHAEVEVLRTETERHQTNQINWLRNLSRYLEHELRNHVFIVQSNLEFLQQDVRNEQRPFVRRAMRSVDKLSALCDSVGEASTLESALQLDQFHPVNFSRMVGERVLERARDLDEANPLELDIDPELWVSGSELRLLQVFDHLLTNALEYSSEDAFVRIEVKSLAGSVYFTVHNRGEPLPEGRDIFAAFESSRPKTSLGMGLYVSHKIVEHHGGTIEAQTQLGQTIVLVTLPQIEAPVSLVGASKPSGAGDNVLNFDRLMRKRPKRSDGGEA